MALAHTTSSTMGIVREGDHSRFVAEADGEGLFGDIADALVDVLAGL